MMNQGQVTLQRKENGELVTLSKWAVYPDGWYGYRKGGNQAASFYPIGIYVEVPSEEPEPDEGFDEAREYEKMLDYKSFLAGEQQ